MSEQSKPKSASSVAATKARGAEEWPDVLIRTAEQTSLQLYNESITADVESVLNILSTQVFKDNFRAAMKHYEPTRF